MSWPDIYNGNGNRYSFLEQCRKATPEQLESQLDSLRQGMGSQMITNESVNRLYRQIKTVLKVSEEKGFGLS